AFIPAYTLFDLGAAYTMDINGHDTTFRINGQNVGGKRYFDGTGGFIISKGQPSQIKFSVSSTF
ncbi:MAG: hypothetical protein JNK21_00360, partial [Rhodospirillaceae bacterium]|nr:hypothetical protein [Rhodospirillaceae bacterium]